MTEIEYENLPLYFSQVYFVTMFKWLDWPTNYDTQYYLFTYCVTGSKIPSTVTATLIIIILKTFKKKFIHYCSFWQNLSVHERHSFCSKMKLRCVVRWIIAWYLNEIMLNFKEIYLGGGVLIRLVSFLFPYNSIYPQGFA